MTSHTKTIAYVEIINYEKTLILINLQKFGDYHFLAFLHCVMPTLQVDVFTFNRNTLVCEI